MKFLHLADLHIGKRLREENLIPDQEYIFNQILSLTEKFSTDGVMIAGDVYDKSVPSAEAVALFDYFLRELKKRGQEVFIVAGNHDSAERLSFASALLETSGVHIAKVYDGAVECVPFEKGGERVNFYLLPFLRPVNVKAHFPDREIASYSDAIRTALSALELKKEQCNILITHQFVTGSQTSGSEEMTVGGINNVDIDAFDGFDFVALGHIHRRQFLGNGRVHYPGTPLKYSLSESKEGRSVTVVTVTGKSISTECAPLSPLRDLREIKGDFISLMRGTSEDYVYLTLTDEEEIPEAVKELRKRYPNLLQVRYENRRTAFFEGEEREERVETPIELFRRLYIRQNNADMTEEQRKLVDGLIEKIWEENA